MLDVFAVMVVASLLELNQFSQFLVAGELDAVNSILQKYAEFHPYLPYEYVGFGVKSVLESGYWLFSTFVCIANPIGIFVMHAASESLVARAFEVGALQHRSMVSHR